VLLNDPILSSLLDAPDAPGREHALERLLVEHVQPVVSRVLGRYDEDSLPKDDADDLAATINLRIVRRLQENAGEDPIQRFDDYVATVAFNVVYAFLRRRYPERTRLKNRLRYVFTHDPRFAMWEIDGEIVCGPSSRRGVAPVPLSLTRDAATRPMLDGDAPATAFLSIFEKENGPLRLSDAVRLAAELWSVAEIQRTERFAEPLEPRTPALELETRQYTEALWREVRLLREQQRLALLMNLRDANGANGVALLLMSGIARFDEIAEAMGMSPDRLSEIWHELPFDDNTIACMLDVTRQQVINLRKAARERLARRMTTFGRSHP